MKKLESELDKILKNLLEKDEEHTEEDKVHINILLYLKEKYEVEDLDDIRRELNKKTLDISAFTN